MSKLIPVFIICLLKGHIWENDDGYPVHGYYDRPTDGSYCLRCAKEVHYD